MSVPPRVVALPLPDGRDSLRFYDVVSGDGTRLRAWTNDADGPTVLLCNGLGTNPYAWPALLRPDCGVRVISWNHRGVGGSERPADRDRVDVQAFVEDALAVLDDAGVDACPVMGWSIGVNTAFELAVRHPERVTGLFAVAGVPGGTFASMGAPLQIPRLVRRGRWASASPPRWPRPAGADHPGRPAGCRSGRTAATCCGTAASCCRAPDRERRRAGGRGVPDHAGRVVHAPGPRRRPARPGLAAAASTCPRSSSPAATTSSPRPPTCARPRGTMPGATVRRAARVALRADGAARRAVHQELRDLLDSLTVRSGG